MNRSFDMHVILNELAKDRPVFHSEADFQFALAWKIQLLYLDASIRLEYNPQVFKSRTYIDIWIRFPSGQNIAIELKYKTKEMKLQHHGETYELARHGAPANNRFLIVQDIGRLQHVVKHVPNTLGYAVIVTNDNEYWQEWRIPKETKDRAFRVHEGAFLSGELKWKEDTAKSTIRSLGESLYLDGGYRMKWFDYSTSTGTIFKFLVNKVTQM